MKSRHEEMREAVMVFHKEYPLVMRLFDRFTRDRINKGFKNYSAKAIFERIRWETDSFNKISPDEFKLNNNFPAFYARAWMKKNPEYDGFFRTRKQTSKDAAPVDLPELGPQDFPYEVAE